MSQETDEERRNRALVETDLRTLSGGGPSAALAALFDPAIVAEEMPNALAPRGVRRDVAALAAAYERGRQVMLEQRYEPLRILVRGDQVAMEVAFSGKLAAAAGPFPAGHVMKGRSALFLEVRAGRIRKLTNYDCFE